MKILFLKIILLLGFIGQLKAQTVFLPNIGTKWHYLFKNFVNGNEKNNTIEYVADSISIVTGEKIKKLIATKLASNDLGSLNKNVLIKQRNDSVWFSHAETNNTWQLLLI